MTKKNLIKLLAEVRTRQHDHEATANPKNLTAYPRGVRKIVQATWTAEAVFMRRIGNALAAAINSTPN